MPTPRSIVRAVALAGGLLAASVAHAMWTHDDAANLPICTAANTQFSPIAMADGSGGAYIAWEDVRTLGTVGIYMQRVSAAGATMWAQDGIQVLSVPANGFVNFGGMASDGTGGVILGWSDRRGASFEAWAQRVNPQGVVQWAANGVRICATSGDQVVGGVVPDGAGGAILAWSDNRTATADDIYAQRVNAAGAAQWAASGVALCTATNTQYAPVLDTDGAGGAIVCWRDDRNGSDVDLYAQRISAAGAPLWAANGVVVSSALSDQTSQSLVSDGTGGAVVAWADDRNANWDIYGEHLTSVGSIEWAVNGTPIFTGAGDQDSPVMMSDGLGGAFVSWIDHSAGRGDVYTQQVSGSGVGQLDVSNSWYTSHATALSIAPGLYRPNLVWDEDYGGGVLRVGINSGFGVEVSGTNANRQHGVAVGDGKGGVIAVWDDARNGASDIYAQRFDPYGFVGDPSPVIVDARDVPGDQGGSVTLRWLPSWLDLGYVSTYRVWRSVPTLAPSARALTARRATTNDPERAVATGELWSGPFGAQDDAWEYVGSTPSISPAPAMYSFAAPTASDSIAGSNPPTHFMVEALRSPGVSVEVWFSAPDSGYSVDNLAPAMPAPLTGTYAAGVTRLHWGPNAEPDFSHYLVYRGTTQGFVPSPANLIASKPDTGFVDNAGATYYYKIVATDVHGNASAPASFPSGTTAVDPNVALAFALESPVPNPARALATIRYSLARATTARLELFDALGRRVRVLLDGPAEAGPHVVPLPLEDAAGRALANGVYLVRLSSDGRSLTRRVAVVR